MKSNNATFERIGSWDTSMLFLLAFICGLLALPALAQNGQSITILDINLESDPDSFLVQVVTLPGYAGRIEVSSLQDENNTQKVELYFEHCFPFSSIVSYDTTFAIEAAYPYDLLILTFLDTTSISSEPPVCVNNYEFIVPLDTLLLTADQLLSSNQPNTALEQIKVYPNPTTGPLYLEIPENLRFIDAQLMDLSGRKIRNWDVFDSQFQVDDLPSGIYLIAIQTNEGLVYKRLIRQ